MIAPVIHSRPLSYEQRLKSRAATEIDLLVIHCTELPDLDTARRYGEKVRYADSETGNSGHFYIDRDGEIQRWVDPARVAHHVRGSNERSLGIELVNIGRFPDWLHSQRQDMKESYPREQMDSLISLVRDLQQTLPGLRWMAGHEDLDRERVTSSNDEDCKVSRKMDPGPLFPWDRLVEETSLQRLSASTTSSPS
jgi:N-acetylmuramoyl-L-alanine amidase